MTSTVLEQMHLRILELEMLAGVMQEEMPEAVRVRLVNILIERLALLRASYMLLVDSTF